jgi:DNA-binding transcriptional MerR regulator
VAMDAATSRYSIGELSRLTGLPVRTIRFYSDSGLVPEAGRTPAGYRTYDREALQRLGLVRTLRDLGIDLPTVRRVLDREVSVSSAAAAHAAALDLQIRGLRLRRAVLRAVVERGAANHQAGPPSGPASGKEVELMNRLAQLSDAERRRMIEDFLDDVFRGLDIDPKFEQGMRSAMPDLPEEPTTAQIEAWVELAELVAEPDFRRRIRQMAQRAADDRAAGRSGDASAGQATAMAVASRAGEAVAAGIDPASAQAAPIVAELVAGYAGIRGESDGPELRRWLVETIDTFADPRAERYWQLLATINGWPAIPSSVPAWEWFREALQASLTAN